MKPKNQQTKQTTIFMKTGTLKNVAAFEKLVGICHDLGASYDPSKAALTPTALATLLEKAQQHLEAVKRAHMVFTLAVNARQETFARINPLVGRVVRALAASESSKQNLYDVRLLNRKLKPQSNPATSSKTGTGEEGSVVTSSYSSSRLDYDGKADTFASLLELLKGCEAYKPNEVDLKLPALNSLLVQLRQSSAAVDKAGQVLAMARINRNKVMFGKDGVHETGTAVKEYIRSVMGVRSEVAKELGKLRLAA